MEDKIMNRKDAMEWLLETASRLVKGYGQNNHTVDEISETVYELLRDCETIRRSDWTTVKIKENKLALSQVDIEKGD